MVFDNEQRLFETLRMSAIKPVECISGAYTEECGDFYSFYIGQTGRQLLDKYKEHLHMGDVRIKSNYAQYNVDNDQNNSSFEDDFKPLYLCKKGKLMDIFVKFETNKR